MYLFPGKRSNIARTPLGRHFSFIIVTAVAVPQKRTVRTEQNTIIVVVAATFLLTRPFDCCCHRASSSSSLKGDRGGVGVFASNLDSNALHPSRVNDYDDDVLGVEVISSPLLDPATYKFTPSHSLCVVPHWLLLSPRYHCSNKRWFYVSPLIHVQAEERAHQRRDNDNVAGSGDAGELWRESTHNFWWSLA